MHSGKSLRIASCLAKDFLSVNNSVMYFKKNDFGNRINKGRQFSVATSASSITQKSNQIQSVRIGVQGACLDRGQPKRGAAEGPKVIRSSGVIEELRAYGHDVHDYGDVPFHTGSKPERNVSENEKRKLKNLHEVTLANKAFSDSTFKILKDERICLTLGGDHSLAIGTINGVSQMHEDLAVLWVDAHSDINTPDTSASGNMHGMPLSFLIKEMQPYMDPLPELSWLTPRISAKNIAFVGLRDVDRAEKTIIEKLGITAFSMEEVDKHGIKNVIKAALDKISPGNKRPLHVSFDIDSLDDLEVSNTGTAVPGGLTLREGLTLLEYVHQAGNMVSMDFVEINPLLGGIYQEKRTAAIANKLLLSTFGYYRGGVSNGTPLRLKNLST